MNKFLFISILILLPACLSQEVIEEEAPPSEEELFLNTLTTTDSEVLALVKEYKQLETHTRKAEKIVTIIEDKALYYRDQLISCKKPENNLVPFMYNITAVPPVEQGFIGEGIFPCQHMNQNASAAYTNVLAHLNYLEALAEDMTKATEVIKEKCLETGGSPNFIAHMELSLGIIENRAKAELYAIRQQKASMFQWLQSFAQCRG